MTAEQVDVPAGRLWTDLDVRVAERGERLELCATYQRARYGDEGAASMVEQLRRLMSSVGLRRTTGTASSACSSCD